MQWCNCNHDNFYDLSACINENDLTCWSCNNRINNEDVIVLLLREVKKLSDKAADIEFERNNSPDIDHMHEKAKEIEGYLEEWIDRINIYKEKDKRVEEAEKETTGLKNVIEDLGNRMASLELKNNKLNNKVEEIESEKKEREIIKFNEEQKRLKKLERELEVMQKQTARFEMMDL